MIEKIDYMVLGLIIVAGWIICIYAINREKKRWNNGKCPECGEEWEMFDMDSQGGRMYKCKNDHRCICTYDVDTKKGE